jgi:hypothetical protein
MLDDVGDALATVADPSADTACPIDTPVLTTGAGRLPFLTHGRLARDALAKSLGPGRLGKGQRLRRARGRPRETFPGSCIGPEQPTPPSDPPSPRPALARPAPSPRTGPTGSSAGSMTSSISRERRSG